MSGTVQCQHCGSANIEGTVKCRICGRPIGHVYEEIDGELVCVSCGARNPEEEEPCNSCKTPLRKIVMSNLPKDLPAEECVHWSEGAASSGRAAKVSIAGVLVLTAGMLGIIQGLFALSPGFAGGFIDAYESIVPGADVTGDALSEYLILQVMAFIFGCLAMFGSVFALTQSRFDMSVVGAVAGIFAIGLILGAFLSLIALLLLATSRKQFLTSCA